MLNVYLLKNNFIMKLHEKNDFAEVSKNLTRYLKIILSNRQNNYVENSSMVSCKKFLAF